MRADIYGSAIDKQRDIRYNLISVTNGAIAKW